MWLKTNKSLCPTLQGSIWKNNLANIILHCNPILHQVPVWACKFGDLFLYIYLFIKHIRCISRDLLETVHRVKTFGLYNHKSTDIKYNVLLPAAWKTRKAAASSRQASFKGEGISNAKANHQLQPTPHLVQVQHSLLPHCTYIGTMQGLYLHLSSQEIFR